MKSIGLIKFSTKNAFRRKTIAILAILGIAMAISLQVTLNTFSNGMTNQFNSLYNNLVGEVNAYESTSVLSQSNIPANIVQDLESSNLSSEINFISPQINLPSTLTSYYSKDGTLPNKISGAPSSISILGVDLPSFMNVSSDLSQLTTNSTYFNNTGLNQVIISNSLLSTNESVFDVGKTVQFQINETSFLNLTIVGITNPTANGLLNLRKGGQTSFNMWTSINTAKEIMHLILDDNSTSVGSARWFHFESKGLDSTGINPNSYTYLSIKIKSTTINETESFMNNLQSYLDSTFNNDYVVVSPQITANNFSTTQQTFSLFIILISIIGVFAGGMGIVIAQLVGVESRMKEFAILKASGWKDIHLIEEVIFESLTLGFIGSLIGFITSIGFIGFLDLFVGSNLKSLIAFSPAAIVNAIILAIIIAIAGGLYPSVKVVKVKPMEVLRTV